MRTTVRLPDDLYSQVRAVALESGETVTSFIEESLRAALLRRRQPAGPRDPYRVDVFNGTGVLPGVDLTDNAALQDVMDAR
jgi:hypothetical protein